MRYEAILGGLGALLLVAACGGAGPEAAASTETSTTAERTAGAERSAPPPETSAPPPVAHRPGDALENPLKTCGAGDSYQRIAAWECPDGSVPLGGDAAAGSRARRGSSRSHLSEPPTDIMNSHIVDIYDVPCPGGTETVYVCMYHCP
ncbi:MAG TPA: hypothetical protein RMH99_05630 [Sandaracinaceae bacterium LLY-WYZ-13_1]|nr:hypothetical protein [Sandaracinaceae bacterium LLY-WYZ-13_1]